METIKQLLDSKGDEVWSIAPDALVLDGLKQMAEKGVGALAVTEQGRLAGIVSERDYARKIILKGKSSKDTQIREIMTEQVVCARLDQQVEECMAIMTEKRIRHMPVVDGEQLVGMLSLGDLVKVVISDQQFTIEQLESYIYKV